MTLQKLFNIMMFFAACLITALLVAAIFPPQKVQVEAQPKKCQWIYDKAKQHALEYENFNAERHFYQSLMFSQLYQACKAGGE